MFLNFVNRYNMDPNTVTSVPGYKFTFVIACDANRILLQCHLAMKMVQYKLIHQTILVKDNAEADILCGRKNSVFIYI